MTITAADTLYALLDTGDLDGAATWRGISKAIEVMQVVEAVGMTH